MTGFFIGAGEETLPRSAGPKLRETSIACPAGFLAKRSQRLSPSPSEVENQNLMPGPRKNPVTRTGFFLDARYQTYFKALITL